MRLLPGRRADAAQQRARDLSMRFGRELRVARVTAGLSQREVASRARLSQPTVSLVERGRRAVGVAPMSRLAAAVGHELAVRLYPSHGISLRDSGQLEIAMRIRTVAHESWRVSMEEPIARAPDRRAADLVLRRPDVTLHVEIERGIVDFQAQLRAAHLKRAELQRTSQGPVRLFVAVPDTPARRRAIAASGAAITAALPGMSRDAWHAIRSGVDPGGDALVWVGRPPPSSPVWNRRRSA